MRMRLAGINLQLSVNGAAEPVVRNHSTHRALNEQFRMTRASGAHVFRFMATDVPGKAHETFLLFLFARHPNLVRIDHDDEIAGINVRRENCLFLSAQQIRGLDRDAAEHLIFGVNQPPLAINFVRFGGKGLHQRLGKGTEATGQERHCQPAESRVNRALKVLYGNYNAPQSHSRRGPPFSSYFRPS